MKLLYIIFFSTLVSALFAQTPFGVWTTVHDETGEKKSQVTLFEKDGKLFGYISKLLIHLDHPICKECKGAKKDKPLVGLVIIENMKKSGHEWTGGTILDPKNGKSYKCTICLEGDDKLKVRGYVGFSLLGRTQYWIRSK
jgi:uncharacterized protein (DUF2147 family)